VNVAFEIFDAKRRPDIAVAAEPLLNSLLDDDVLDDGYVCQPSAGSAGLRLTGHRFSRCRSMWSIRQKL
jgi:hypothetical protein